MVATDAIVLLIGSFNVNRKAFDLGGETQLCDINVTSKKCLIYTGKTSHDT